MSAREEERKARAASVSLDGGQGLLALITKSVRATLTQTTAHTDYRSKRAPSHHRIIETPFCNRQD